MKGWLIVAAAVAASSPGAAIVAVFGNVSLDGDAAHLRRLVPAFRKCGAKKIRYEKYWEDKASLSIDQNPDDRQIFACVKRVAMSQRPNMSVTIRPYGKYEI